MHMYTVSRRRIYTAAATDGLNRMAPSILYAIRLKYRYKAEKNIRYILFTSLYKINKSEPYSWRRTLFHADVFKFDRAYVLIILNLLVGWNMFIFSVADR